MQDAVSDASTQSGGRDDSYNSIVSDLASLIAHVEAGINLIETAIARESPLGNQEISTNVVVLDDVTPRYIKANAALNTCHANLGVALHFLMDSRTAKREANHFTACDCRPVRATSRT
jgi:hypothetical protein